MSEQTAATSSPAVDSTQRCKVGRAILRYAQGDLKRWQDLDDLTGKSEFSVYDLFFDHRAQFCQKLQGSKCVLLYLPGQLVEPSIANLKNGNLELQFKVLGTPQVSFKGGADAQNFPLAKLHGNFYSHQD